MVSIDCSFDENDNFVAVLRALVSAPLAVDSSRAASVLALIDVAVMRSLVCRVRTFTVIIVSGSVLGFHYQQNGLLQVVSCFSYESVFWLVDTGLCVFCLEQAGASIV